MEGALGLAALTFAAHAATNMDNVALMVGMASGAGQSRRSVVTGAFLASAGLISICLIAALTADLLPQYWLGYLGLIPIAFGLIELRRQAQGQSGSPGSEAERPRAFRSADVATVMLANSSDSVAALLPLFAETRDALLALIGAVVLAVGTAAGALACWIAAHPRIGPPIQRVAPRLVPWVLIGVGVYILWNTGTDTAP